MLTCAEHDNSIRWVEGERLEHLFEDRCDQFELEGRSNHKALISGDLELSYRDLDRRANQLARHLLQRGIRPGNRVGLLFDKSFHTHVALLAVLKINAAYVPLDPSFPPDRMAFITKDARIDAFVSLSKFDDNLRKLTLPVIFLDTEEHDIALENGARLLPFEKGESVDQLCYIIYTSGTTGNPKGVAIEHSSVCNFVHVAREVYGIEQSDRVFQGMTIAFDFSVEELWVPLATGATLVLASPGSTLVGSDLADFLGANRITALCCVPTLLASIDVDLPDLRFLLVSGEACPESLIAKWHSPTRKILNAYGPTEATVTATLGQPHPDKPITIGTPLPSYTVVILDEDLKEVPDGQPGEICIGGIGLAKGYVNRKDLTNESFIPDSIGIPNNPSGRIYRTGDQGVITGEQEIAYLGRIDTQVKIRGYRIELGEIESTLTRVPGIAQAIVDTNTMETGIEELVAYCVLDAHVAELPTDAIAETLSSHLPSYMIPNYLETIAEIPMLASGKADRKRLPAPTGPRFIARDAEFVAPSTEMEKALADALVDTMKIDRVSAADDFFDDLGAHSLLMAQYCAHLRSRLPHVDVAMRDIYLNPTIGELAAHLETTTRESTTAESHRIPSNAEYYGCGFLQAVSYGAFLSLLWWVFASGVLWIYEATTLLEFYVRTAGFSAALFFGWVALPIVVKWTLIGRWKAETFPIWSLRYFRFWLVKFVITANPMAMFKGLPLFNVYLRLLGAKIGRRVVFETKRIPVCTDLLSIGDDTLIRRETILPGYVARSGYIHTGPVQIGRNAYVGNGAVLEPFAEMQDDAQLGHASALLAEQAIPAGRHYHGSPAVRTTANYIGVEPKVCSTLRRTIYTITQLLSLFILGPVIPTLLMYGFGIWLESPAVVTYGYLAFWSFAIYFGLLLVGLLPVALMPRALNLLVREGRIYPLFGVHYLLVQMIRSASNSRIYNLIFGDSSAIVHYLRFIGYDLSDRIVQSGSNFGVDQKHDNPLLCSIGTGTMAADGLAISNVHMSNTSFKVSRTTIGPENYIGNSIHYPPDGKTGSNCLLATKVMIPIDGETIENTGLLGSPPFRVPRAVDQDRDLAGLIDERERLERLGKKNRHNFASAVSFLFWRWLFMFIALAISFTVSGFYETFGVPVYLVALVFIGAFYIAYYIAIERVTMRLARLAPAITSIYEASFWRVERYWKHSEDSLKHLFTGTPFKNVITRLSGARVGKKVFDDGLAISEKSLVEIGDYCTFNVDGGLQSHSLEEAVFKCDYVRVGNGCTTGINVLVHYGTTMEDNAILGTDSFLMKGETTAANSVWLGNPARQV